MLLRFLLEVVNGAVPRAVLLSASGMDAGTTGRRFSSILNMTEAAG